MARKEKVEAGYASFCFMFSVLS